MRDTPHPQSALRLAFPKSLQKSAALATFLLATNPHHFSCFKVRIRGEDIFIPQRIHHSLRLIGTWWVPDKQKALLNCLMTRHGDGFVRQAYLEQIIHLHHIWVVPFVIQLVGEYVVQIITVIESNLDQLDKHIYKEFLEENPQYWKRTASRVESYWNCYYRGTRRENYSGFRVVDYFRALQ